MVYPQLFSNSDDGGVVLVRRGMLLTMIYLLRGGLEERMSKSGSEANAT